MKIEIETVDGRRYFMIGEQQPSHVDFSTPAVEVNHWPTNKKINPPKFVHVNNIVSYSVWEK